MPFKPFEKKESAPAQEAPSPNPSHDGNHGAHAPNGHHTPAKQKEHQKSLNQAPDSGDED